MGLPLGIVLADRTGSQVTLLDIDPAKVDTVNRGVMPFMERGAEPVLRRVIGKTLHATLDTHCGRQNRRPEVRRTCPHCGKEFVASDPRRRYCSRYCGRRWDRHAVPRPGARRVERPPYEELVAAVAAMGWSAVGRRYGVSDNAVRKWVRAYEAERRGAGSEP